MNRWIFLTMVVPLTLTGCSSANTPEGVAERFVEAYYVRIDQAQALDLTAALAREKLQRELQLVTDARRGGGVEQARPKIEYTRAQTRPEGQRVFVIYDLTIKPTQVPPILKRVLITTAQLEDHWKVINFAEVDAPR